MQTFVLVSEVVDLVDSIIRSAVCELLLVPVTQKPIARVPTHTYECEHVVHSKVYQQLRLPPSEAMSFPS